MCSGQVPWIAHVTWNKQLPQHSPMQYKVVVVMGSALVTACWKHFAQAGMGLGACCDHGPWSSSALVPGPMVPYTTPWTSGHHNMVLETIYGSGLTLDVVNSTMFFGGPRTDAVFIAYWRGSWPPAQVAKTRRQFTPFAYLLLGPKSHMNIVLKWSWTFGPNADDHFNIIVLPSVLQHK